MDEIDAKEAGGIIESIAGNIVCNILLRDEPDIPVISGITHSVLSHNDYYSEEKLHFRLCERI